MSLKPPVRVYVTLRDAETGASKSFTLYGVGISEARRRIEEAFKGGEVDG